MSKIVHVNKAYPPHFGGVETVCRQYAELSTAIFDSVDVLTVGSRFGFGVSTETSNGLTIRRCDYQFAFAGQKVSVPLILLLWKYYLKRALIHLHDPFPLANLPLLLARRPRLIVTYHSDIVRQKSLKRLVDRIRSATLRKASLITVTSEQLKRNSDLLANLPTSCQIVLPLFLDDTFKYCEPLPLSGLSRELESTAGESPFLLMVGRMCYYKGLDVVLAALRHNHTRGCRNVVRIVIAGQNSDNVAATLSDELRNYQDVVRIDRSLSDPEKIHLLQSCTALLFPSNKPSEAFGIVQLEALAAGKPVINFNLPTGVPAVSVNGKTGLTFELNDHLAIADLLAGRGGYLDRLAKIQAEDIADHLVTFSREAVSETLSACYKTLEGDSQRDC